MESDVAYFRRRASDERTAALAARHKDAREAHTAMAERYEDLVRAICEREHSVQLGDKLLHSDIFSRPIS